LDVSKALQFKVWDAQDLNDLFEDNSFDLYTIAFGLRNVTDVDLALAEAYRVLKPGGRFMCLEFSYIPNETFRAIYDAYSFNVIPAMGEYIAKDRSSYQYLVESIRKFSNQQELVARLEQVGFQAVRYTNLAGGIVALHEGWKPAIM
jgi:ubiquinone/menaquinone biosynthesis methyltransferase